MLADNSGVDARVSVSCNARLLLLLLKF
jgi:hypothetical protein